MLKEKFSPNHPLHPYHPVTSWCALRKLNIYSTAPVLLSLCYFFVYTHPYSWNSIPFYIMVCFKPIMRCECGNKNNNSMLLPHLCTCDIPRVFYSLQKCVFIFPNKYVTSLFCALVHSIRLLAYPYEEKKFHPSFCCVYVCIFRILLFSDWGCFRVPKIKLYSKK